MRRVSEEHNGWTNWETWNTALMMDNEYDLYKESRKLFENGMTVEQLRDWLITKVIGPHNRDAIADAKDWNEIPEDERIDHSYEEYKDKHGDDPNAMDLFHGLVGGPDVSDSEPTLIDQELVNFQEIWDHLYEEVQGELDWKEKEQQAAQQGIKFYQPGSDPTSNHNLMYDAYLKSKGAMSDAEIEAEGGKRWDHPKSPSRMIVNIPFEHIVQGATGYHFPKGFSMPDTNMKLWELLANRYPEESQSLNWNDRATWARKREQLAGDYNDPEQKAIIDADPKVQEMMQNGFDQRLSEHGWNVIGDIQRGKPNPYTQEVADALRQQGYTDEQIAETMKPKWRWDPQTDRWEDIERMDQPETQIDKSLDQPGTLTMPEDWHASKTAETASDGRLVLYRGVSLSRNEGAALARDPQAINDILRSEGHLHWTDSYNVAAQIANRNGLPGLIIEGLVNPQDVVQQGSGEWSDLVHNNGVFVPGTTLYEQEREVPVRQGAQIEVASISLINDDEMQEIPGPRVITATAMQYERIPFVVTPSGVDMAGTGDSHADMGAVGAGWSWGWPQGEVKLFSGSEPVVMLPPGMEGTPQGQQVEAEVRERMKKRSMVEEPWRYRVPFILYPTGEWTMGRPGDEHVDVPLTDADLYWQQQEDAGRYEENQGQYQGHIIFDPDEGEIEQWGDHAPEDLKQTIREEARRLFEEYGPYSDDGGPGTDWRYASDGADYWTQGQDDWWGQENSNLFNVNVPGEAPGMPRNMETDSLHCPHCKGPMHGLKCPSCGFEKTADDTMVATPSMIKMPDDTPDDGWGDGQYDTDTFLDHRMLNNSLKTQEQSQQYLDFLERHKRSEQAEWPQVGMKTAADGPSYADDPEAWKADREAWHAQPPRDCPRCGRGPTVYGSDMHGEKKEWCPSCGWTDRDEVQQQAVPKPGDYAKSRDGHPVQIVGLHTEGENLFATIRYLDGYMPYPSVGGRAGGSEDDPLWEHRVYDGKVIRPGGDYYNDKHWVIERGLQLGSQDSLPGLNTAKTAADNVPGAPVSDSGHWVWLDGKVGFGEHHDEIAKNLADELGYNKADAAYISNWLARGHCPEDKAVAVGTFKNKRPQIWNSTRDRNHIWDAVMEARENHHVAEVMAPTQIPNPNYVLDYNPEDNRDTGWQSYAQWKTDNPQGIHHQRMNEGFQDMDWPNSEFPKGTYSPAGLTWKQAQAFILARCGGDGPCDQIANAEPNQPFYAHTENIEWVIEKTDSAHFSKAARAGS